MDALHFLHARVGNLASGELGEPLEIYVGAGRDFAQCHLAPITHKPDGRFE